MNHGWCTRLILGALLGLAAAAAGAHPLGRPPGRLIDVDGHRMHLYCRGVGKPTVVLDTGLGGVSLEWMPVLERVARFARVCLYDRAGYGWSDMGALPRTSAREVDELQHLLVNAGVAGPYVLVGHSFGGYNAQLFARRFPALTAGLVLVDSSHPTQVERFQAPPYNMRTVPSARFGTVVFGEVPAPHPSLSRLARLQTLYQFKNWKPRRTMSYELFGFRDSAHQVAAAPPLRPVPLVVLTRGKRAWPNASNADQLERLWLDLQADLAAQSPHAAHLVARDSGHLIHLEQPALVAYAIALVCDAAVPPSGSGAVRAMERHDGIVSSAIWLHDTLGFGPPGDTVALREPTPRTRGHTRTQ